MINFITDLLSIRIPRLVCGKKLKFLGQCYRAQRDALPLLPLSLRSSVEYKPHYKKPFSRKKFHRDMLRKLVEIGEGKRGEWSRTLSMRPRRGRAGRIALGKSR